MTDEPPRPIRPIPFRKSSAGGLPPRSTSARRGRGDGGAFWRSAPGWIALAAILLLLTVAPLAARRVTDWLWYREIGFERVFVLKILAQWILGLLAGVGGFLLLYLNARVALRVGDDPEITSFQELRVGDGIGMAGIARLMAALALPVALLLTVPFAATAAGEWRTVVQFLYRSPFGTTDPVFGRDVAYYVFTLPVIEGVLDYASLALVLALVLALPIYLARQQLVLRWPRPWIAPAAQLHLAVLVALLLVATGVRRILVDVPALLHAAHAPLQGASYTDLHVRMPMLRLVGTLAILAAGLVLWGGRRGTLLRTGGRAIGAYVVLAILLLGVVPGLFQRLAVQPNELARELPQIRHHIAATRAAWGLDGVERRDLAAEQRLTMRDIEANQATLANVRLWDREPLLQTFGQIQAIRTYYDFVAVDDDRYRIGGELRQVLLSARELDSGALPTRTFINEHLTFTHGMGLTLGPANQVTAEGLPVLWIKDLPPESSVPGLRVTRPQIYFGELPNTFVLAPTRQREFDYPAGEGDAAMYSTYAGRAGVPVGSFGRRLLFALRFRSLNVLLSRDLTAETRVLFHRNIRERAALALPFLRFDRDPYLVVGDDGRLTWILDAYTTTDRYPYAQRLADGTRYMRNSVKVTIGAYDGDVRAYLADPRDPMIRTLARIYPGLLRPLDSMPADLRAHIRYPEDLFRAQTALYALFHMTNPETFYHREDQWQVPASPRGSGGEEGFIRHMVMRLPGERAPEFILMRPFTPRQKDNLAAWMVARNDGEHYGQLIAYRFPRQSLVFGPAQIVNRINQDTEVARQVSLWDQRGSEVIRGELLVIPIEASLLYVQPLYLRAEGGRIPELKRVIVAHESQVVMEETLEAGLRRLFGERAAPAPASAPTTGEAPAAGTTPSDTEGLIRQAVQHYERARAAQRADDWTTYGAEMRRLGEVLRRLEEERARKQ